MHDIESAVWKPISNDSESEPIGLAFTDCFDEDNKSSNNKLDWLPPDKDKMSSPADSARELLRDISALGTYVGALQGLKGVDRLSLGSGLSVRMLDAPEHDEVLFNYKSTDAGPRTTRHAFASDGKTRKSTMEYTSDGTLASRTEYGADGQTRVVTFDFNQPRNLWLKTEFAPDGKTPSELSILDSHGSPLQTKTLYSDGKTSKTRTLYSKDGEILKRTDYTKAGKASSDVSYASGKPSSRIEYDQEGRKARVVGYFENGQLKTDITFYNNGKLKEQTYYLADGKKSLHVEDDKDGNSIRTEYKDGYMSRSLAIDSRDKLNAEWTYHENGRMKTMTLHTSSGKSQVITFDEGGRR